MDPFRVGSFFFDCVHTRKNGTIGIEKKTDNLDYSSLNVIAHVND